MNLVEINVKVDVNKPEQVIALNSFLTSLSEPVTITTDKTPTVTKTAKVPSKKMAVVQNEAPEEEVQTEEEDFKEEAASESNVKLEDLRAILQTKVKGPGNKDLVKLKLTELKAENLTGLDKKHYQTMYDYLNGLD